MRQEVVIFRVGQFDRERVVNVKLKELNDRGWIAKSFTFWGEDRIVFLIEKENKEEEI